ncbi:hypothetical protein L2E82_06147 [Cichorium intybus]|uniref:Uncharacterized protein n=1 Tax=Cichorium intybus TaxID=13427 RepID=A0ACB9H9P7_CICIN|nr:hypothetical protein L2E82_06147 [Cichorium intybus]
MSGTIFLYSWSHVIVREKRRAWLDWTRAILLDMLDMIQEILTGRIEMGRVAQQGWVWQFYRAAQDWSARPREDFSHGYDIFGMSLLSLAPFVMRRKPSCFFFCINWFAIWSVFSAALHGFLVHQFPLYSVPGEVLLDVKFEGSSRGSGASGGRTGSDVYTNEEIVYGSITWGYSGVNMSTWVIEIVDIQGESKKNVSAGEKDVEEIVQGNASLGGREALMDGLFSGEGIDEGVCRENVGGGRGGVLVVGTIKEFAKLAFPHTSEQEVALTATELRFSNTCASMNSPIEESTKKAMVLNDHVDMLMARSLERVVASFFEEVVRKDLAEAEANLEWLRNMGLASYNLGVPNMELPGSQPGRVKEIDEALSFFSTCLCIMVLAQPFEGWIEH